MKVNKEEEQRGKYKNVQSKKKKIWRKKVEDERRKQRNKVKKEKNEKCGRELMEEEGGGGRLQKSHGYDRLAVRWKKAIWNAY